MVLPMNMSTLAFVDRLAAVDPELPRAGHAALPTLAVETKVRAGPVVPYLFLAQQSERAHPEGQSEKRKRGEALAVAQNSRPEIHLTGSAPARLARRCC